MFLPHVLRGETGWGDLQDLPTCTGSEGTLLGPISERKVAEKPKSQPEHLALLGADGPGLSGRGHRAGVSSRGAWDFLSVLAESPVSERAS